MCLHMSHEMIVDLTTSTENPEYILRLIVNTVFDIDVLLFEKFEITQRTVIVELSFP